jgi:hypothetical protein
LKDLIKTHRGERKEFFSAEDEQIRQKKKQTDRKTDRQTEKETKMEIENLFPVSNEER